MAEEAPGGGEKTEEPTTKRREDFRKKGQVAQSKEVHTAMLLTLVLVFWLFYMRTFFKELTELIAHVWQSIGQFEVSPASFLQLGYFLVGEMLFMLAPLYIFVIIVGIFASSFQIGWVFTAHPLKLDISKLDPIKGAKKFISRKSFVDLLKSIVKILFFGWLAYSTVFDKIEESLLLADQNALVILTFIIQTAGLIIAKVCAALIIFAFLDYLYVKWEMEQKMMMSKQELKEEYKGSEGDPQVKARIRSIQQDMARKRMMAEVPEADVVITNPTHYAIAVKYDSEQMDAPVIIAKGMDHLAMKIREIARESDVPIVENPPVARLLHKIDLGAHIPEDMFKAVAEILAHVYSIKGKSV